MSQSFFATLPRKLTLAKVKVSILLQKFRIHGRDLESMNDITLWCFLTISIRFLWKTFFLSSKSAAVKFSFLVPEDFSDFTFNSEASEKNHLKCYCAKQTLCAHICTHAHTHIRTYTHTHARLYVITPF